MQKEKERITQKGIGIKVNVYRTKVMQDVVNSLITSKGCKNEN